ncbi:MAG: tandem-95 repeat protein [Chitinophagaceae bacterium]|nr:tandem-95 repeat protein [Chitinophagaceae bacterium]
MMAAINLQASVETLSTGAFIINMGVVPQTVNNGIKPYGMIYDLMRSNNVPIKWVISQTKGKDGVDFVYNGVSYKGGVFIIPAEFRDAAVNAKITSWTSQGVVGVTTTTPLTVDVTYTLTSIPRWTINSQNGAIGEAFLTTAGINNTAFPGAYNYQAVAGLSCCDDMFVMPHADPTWATHNRLYTWNKDCLGSIWLGCHSGSALSNSINPNNPAQQMNFLSTRTNVTTPAPWPNNSLELWTSHNDGSVPYTNRLPNDPIAQYMGSIDAATQNGSEQIYMPVLGSTARWNPGAKIIVYDPTQADVTNVLPDLSNSAAVLVYGRGFDSLNRGYVMAMGSHNINGSGTANVAAIRTFFNFSLFQMLPKSPQMSVSGVSSGTVIQGGNTMTGLSVTATSFAGANFTYEWSSTCGGTFSAPTASTTNYTAPVVAVTTNCIITCKVVDLCGRTTFTSIPITIIPPPAPPIANPDVINIGNSCTPGTVTINALANDTDPQGAAITFDSLFMASATPAGSGTWSATPLGVVSFTPNPNFAGTTSIMYGIHNIYGGVATSTVTVNVGTPDANGCFPNSVYGVQSSDLLNLTDNFVSQSGTGAALNGTALDDIEDTYTTAATDYLNFGTAAANNLVLSTGSALRFKDSINLYWSKGTANSAATVSIQIGQSSTGPWTNTQTFTIPASPNGTGATVSTMSVYAIPSGASGITHIRISTGTPPATNSVANVWVDAVEYEYLNCVPKNPNLGDDEITILEDIPSIIDVYNNDIDPSGLPLTIKQIVQQPAFGKVSINQDGSITYVNNNDVSGIDSFMYQACNSEGYCSEATVRVLINDDGCSANQYRPSLGIPVTKVFQYQFAGTNAATANSTSTNFRDSWMDQASGGNDNKGGANKMEIGKVFSSTNARRGIAYFNISEIPTSAIITSASLSLRRVGGDNNTQIINLHALNNSFVENQVTWLIRSTGNNWTPAGGQFTAGITSSASVPGVNANYSWTVGSLVQNWVSTPANNFGVLFKTGETLNKRHQFATKEDGTISNRPVLTVNYLQLAPCAAIPNRAPFANPDLGATTSTASVSIPVLVNDLDPDGNTISLLSILSATNGSAVVSGNNVVFTPTFGFNGEAKFRYIISDGTVTDTAESYVNVTNAAPIASNDFPAGVNSGTTQNVDVGLNDSDPEGSPLTYSIYQGGQWGTASIIGSIITYTPISTFFGNDTVYYQIAEGNSGCSSGLLDSAYVVFTMLNQPPTVCNFSDTTYTCDPLIIDLTLCAIDPEGWREFLVNIVGSLSNPAAGTIVNNNDGSVTFIPTPGFIGSVTFSYTVTDNGTPPLTSAPGVVTIVVLPPLPNIAPVAVVDYADTIETDQPLYYNVRSNDYDPNNDIISKPVITVAPLHGTATVLGNGLVFYMPTPGFHGIDSLTYQICDSVNNASCVLSQGLCATAKMYITVLPKLVQHALPDINQTLVNVPVGGTVATNDNAIPGSTFTALGSMSNGTLVLNSDGSYIYTPNPGFVGRDSISYEVCSPPVPIILCSTTTLTIEVTPVYANLVNTVIAQDDHATTPFSMPIEICVKCNDSDPDGNVIGNPSIYIPPMNGTVTVNPSGTVTYTPNLDFSGMDYFTYIICDNGNPLACDTALVTIDIVYNAVSNNQTYANDDAYSTNVNTPVNNSVANNDSDPQGDICTFSVVSGPAHGLLTLNTNGTFVYTPASGYKGPDQFVYSKCDNGTPVACDTATAYITMNARIQDANPDINQTLVNTPVSGTVALNDNVLPGSTFSPLGGMSNGTIVFNTDGSYTYTPNPHFVGTDSMSYVVCSPTPPGLCDTTTLTIEVTPLYYNIGNDVIAHDDNASTPMGTQVNICLLCNDHDPNGNTIGIPVILMNSAHGTYILNPNGTISYTPAPGYSGNDYMQYVICDNGIPVACDTANVYIVIGPATVDYNQTYANDDANSTIINTAVGGTVADNDTDPQGDAVNFTLLTNPAHGSVIFNPNGTYTYSPAANYTGPDQFTYYKCDNGLPVACDTATVYITVTKPYIETNPDFNVTYVNVSVPGNVNTNDITPVGTTYGTPTAVPGNPGGAMPVVNSNGTYTFITPIQGVYQFLVPVCEPGQTLDCISELLTITVLPLTDVYPPIANTDIATTPMSTPVTLISLSNDAATLGFALIPGSVTITDLPNHGSAVVNPLNGNITYTPDAGYVGMDTLKYQVCQNTIPSTCATAYQIITIQPSDWPNSTTAADDYYSTGLNQPVSGNVKTNDTDPEGHAQTVTPQTTTISGKGTLVLNSDGTFTFTPTSGYKGPVEFPYTICDNGVPQECASATLHILIIPPDVTPNITCVPNVLHGIQTFNTTITVTELNHVNTDGTITVLVPKDSRVTFTYNPSLTNVGFTPVSNSIWSYNGTNAFFHIFTTTSTLLAGTSSTFGFVATFNPNNSDGKYTMTSNITSGSGGEIRTNNNTDAEALDYFHN